MQAGLVLWTDEGNFLSLVYEWGEGPAELHQKNQRMFTACVATEACPIFSWYYALQNQGTVWLRVTKRLKRYELSTSTDGETFTPLHLMRARGVVDDFVSWGDDAVRRVSLFANSGSGAKATPAHASFDLFKVMGLPTEHEPCDSSLHFSRHNSTMGSN